MSRRLPLVLVLLALSAVVVFALVPKRSPGGGSPADLLPYQFANVLPDVNPPIAALSLETLADPVRRTAARIEWGPPDVFYWSVRRLPEDRGALARVLLVRLEEVLVGSPLLAQRLIDALAVVADPEARATLMRIAETPPPSADFLQVAAVRALARYPADEEIAALFARLSKHPSRSVRTAAVSEVVKSEAFGDEEVLRGFLEAIDGPDAVPFLHQVFARRLAGCADDCARHLESPHLRARQTAILALLALGDPRGFEAGEAELSHENPERAGLGLSLFRDARVALPWERARALAASRNGPIRRELAGALGPWLPAADVEQAIALLRVLGADSDPVVRQAAVRQLWSHGRQEGAEIWRETLRRGHGAALREAAQFLCETLRDPTSAPIVRGRLAHEELDGPDRANLLSGLRHVGGPQDVPEYVERILEAGTRADVRGSERVFLSEYASLYVQTMGAAAAAPLARALPRARTARAKLALLDALRGVVKGADPDSARVASEAVFALLLEPSEPGDVREAAADTLAFFDDRALGERLLSLRDRVGDKALADRILKLYASFF